MSDHSNNALRFDAYAPYVAACLLRMLRPGKPGPLTPLQRYKLLQLDQEEDTLPQEREQQQQNEIYSAPSKANGYENYINAVPTDGSINGRGTEEEEKDDIDALFFDRQEREEDVDVRETDGEGEDNDNGDYDDRDHEEGNKEVEQEEETELNGKHKRHCSGASAGTWGLTSEDASDYGCSSKSREKRGREDWEKAEETGDEEEGEDEEKEVEGKKGSESSPKKRRCYIYKMTDRAAEICARAHDGLDDDVTLVAFGHSRKFVSS